MRTRSVLSRTLFYFQLMLVMLLLIVGITVAANAQERSGLPANQPKVDIKVSKQVDANGKVMKYDSVYTWSYSSGNIPADLLWNKSKTGLHSNQLNNLDRYTDSLWRSMFMPMNLMPISDVTRNLMRSMEQAMQQISQQQLKQKHKPLMHHEPGGKKSAAKATRSLTT